MHDLLDRYSRRVWEEAGTARRRARAAGVHRPAQARALERRLARHIRRAQARPAERRARTRGSWPAAPRSRRRGSACRRGAARDDLGSGPADPRLERRLLTAIAEAARLAASDERKTRFLLRLLSRIREPAIVFTEYRDTLARLAERVAAAGHTVAVLHGGMTPAERSRTQQAFNERGGMLLATDAASEGLNLHHRCRVVIHFELPWNPSRLEQRAGRVDRLGSDPPGARAGARRRAHGRAPRRRAARHPARRQRDEAGPDARRVDGVARGRSCHAEHGAGARDRRAARRDAGVRRPAA